MAMSSLIRIATSLLIMMSSLWMGEARIPGVYSGGAWQNAHATFYGGADASGTMGESLFLTHCSHSINLVNSARPSLN